MEQTPSKMLHRLMVVASIFLLIGIIVFFLNKIIGGMIIAVGVIGAIPWVIYYNKLKKQDPLTANKSLTSLSMHINKSASFILILGGSLMLILGLAVLIFERENFKEVIFEVGEGIVLLALGIYLLKSKQAQKTTWKDIPLGMRVIIIFLAIIIAFGLRNFAVNLQEPNFLFGVYIQPPLSTVLSVIFLVIPIIIIFLIYQKVGWKIILGLESFNFLNGLFGAIKILLTPLPQLFSMMNKPLPNVSPEILQAAELKSKLIISIPMFTGIIISLVILIYIYKRKEYFHQ